MAENRLIVSGGRVFTGDPDSPWADAVVVEGSQISFVGDLAAAHEHAGPEAETFDASGGLVLPGFVDGHAHLLMTGASLLKAQLRDAQDLEEIQERLRAWAQANPDAPRVLGIGWVHDTVAGGHPTREMLDAVVSDRPVYVEAYDLHSCWVNTAALEELGITDSTPDPQGGRIVRDPASGKATGHLLETVMLERVWPLLNDLGPDELDRNLEACQAAYARVGVTSAVEMALESRELEAMARARDAGTLTTRIVAHAIIHRRDDPAEELAQVEAAARLSKSHSGDLLRVAGIKIISDGVIDTCTAALLEPYANGENEEPIWDPEALEAVVSRADALGLQVAIHAIGDRAVRCAIDALESAAQRNGTSGRRHRIEHLEYADPADIDRLAPLGITASMQPIHVDPRYLGNWIAMLGHERAENGFAWPRYRETGATLAFGTDTPTASFEPMGNMYVASTRKSPTDAGAKPLRPEWALPMEDAIGHATRESAWAARLEHCTGVLRPGLFADLTVLDTDPLAKGPEALLEASVRLTLLGGQATYRAP